MEGKQNILPPEAAQPYVVQQTPLPPGYPAAYGQVAPPPQQQPAIQWMPLPQPVPGCPRGLEYLTQLDQVLIHQQVELLEESDFCMRNCCGPNRGFIMHITDNLNQEVIRIERPFKCCAGCCWCATGGHCSHIIDIEAPPGNVIGKVVQDQSLWRPYYRILDASGQEIFKIKGPCCVCSGVCCTCDFPFEIFAGDTDGEPVGRICKQYSGLVKEMFTQATNFSATFPMDLDVKMKATLLGATFLIDFMFFEQKKNNNRDY